MTDYEKLTEVLTAAIRAQDLYLAECHRFAVALVDGFAKALGCPRGKLHTQRDGADWLNGDDAPLPEALEWRHDGFHYLRLRVSLPGGGVALPIRFKRLGARFLVQLVPKHEEDYDRIQSSFEIDSVSMEGANEAFADWVNRCIVSLGGALERFLGGSQEDLPVRPIGFKFDGT